MSEKVGYGIRCFDCRRFVKPGDKVSFSQGMKEDDIKGTLKVKRVYEQFVVLQSTYTEVTVNRWNIISVNGWHIEGGCFGKIMEDIGA